MDATPQLTEVTPQMTNVTPPMTDVTPQPTAEPTNPPFPTDRKQEVHRVASELYRQKPDWVTFFREVLGIDGVARRLYPSPDQMAELERSEEYLEIQQMLAKLRTQSTPPPNEAEPTRVITVRLPKSLHESLRTEAHERRTSMNKLCISKLLQMVDDQLVPAE